MQELATKGLIIFAGKGGVGKTTCSAATALELAARGRKTLLVTVDPAKRLEDSLGVPVGSRPTPIQPNLAALMLDPADVITEHLERELPDLKVTEHPMFRFVAKNMPGLNELMAIGKLNDLRRDGTYDVIVVDTAPTGHALSFLSVPKTMRELMGERSLLKWAMRGYAVWQKLSGAARTMGNVFRRKDDQAKPLPDIDFEKVFAGIEEEAGRVQSFLTDPAHSALILVTLPEKLPVEETCDLEQAVREDLGMQVAAIVVNKIQPDALGEHMDAFDAVKSGRGRAAFVKAAAKATRSEQGLIDALLDAAEFGEVRRAMNLAYVDEIRRRLPRVPLTLVPLAKEDVQGLTRLAWFRSMLFR